MILKINVFILFIIIFFFLSVIIKLYLISIKYYLYELSHTFTNFGSKNFFFTDNSSKIRGILLQNESSTFYFSIKNFDQCLICFFHKCSLFPEFKISNPEII